MNRRLRATLLGLLAAIAVVVPGVAAAMPAAADNYVPISGAGSSWSSNAIDQWRRNVQQYGMRINYASTGSSDGRNQFKAGTVDFASSEIPYGVPDNGVIDQPPTAGTYAYMPIVAGGTAFMYNLSSGTKRITNLRLSGKTLTNIFTGNIKKWNDPQIKADNPGLTLPDRSVVVVVRSDGSGSTAQFTSWMDNQYSSIWAGYCQRVGRVLTGGKCGTTSNYPTTTGMISQPNSQGVAGYVSQKANIGTITYVEYSYALKTGYPVAKILNKGGYYVQPTAQNVAVGLLQAKINTDKNSPAYLTQILTGVYNDPDPRTYPLSSYSYFILPTTVHGSFTTDKGKTLAAFAYYFLCEGQQQADALGYSPLPINLVKAGLEQVKKIPGAVTENVDIKSCHNPTFSSNGTNTLAKNAPQPSACDKAGNGQQCGTNAGTSSGNGGGSNGGGTTNGGGTNGGGTTDGAGTDGGGTTDGGGATDPGTTGGEGGGGSVDGGSGSGETFCEADTGICGDVAALPVEVSADSSWTPAQTWMLVAVIGVLALIIIPPVVGQLIGRRRRQG